MRTFLLFICISVACVSYAQRNCATSEYLNTEISSNPSLQQRFTAIENFIADKISQERNMRSTGAGVIKIPVVVHVLYNAAAENISDAQIKSQIEVLNKDFRRLNADTVNTPARFKPFAADVEIEFALATADPKGRATTGVIRKKTAVTGWSSDDKIKFTSEGGDNAWDTKNYLNIWIGNLRGALGYAAAPGSDAAKDGIVINYSYFGTINTSTPYNLGRTAVHEIGHWLGLKHIWGDTYCGSDGVADTPPQSNFTTGCPTGFLTSCNNSNTGDMYMNYMDFTNDACINLFTAGQKQRMRALFATGGPRAGLLTSKGLNEPWLEEAPAAEEKSARVFPNPARNEVYLNFGDDSWIGKNIQVISTNGSSVQQLQIISKLQKVELFKLPAGMYLIKVENGEKKFIQKLLKL